MAQGSMGAQLNKVLMQSFPLGTEKMTHDFVVEVAQNQEEHSDEEKKIHGV